MECNPLSKHKTRDRNSEKLERQNNMTKREFYEAILTENAEITAEMMEIAQAEIDKLNAVATKRAETQAEKSAVFNQEVQEYIAGLVVEGEFITATDAAAQFGTSVQKASAILRRAVALELAAAQDVKIVGKGKVKGYTLLD